MQALNRILWSIDVFQDLESQKNALFTLGALTRATGAEVLPTFILSPPFSSERHSLKHVEEAYQALAEKKMAELSKAAEISSMQKGRILHSHTGSIAQSVGILIQEAIREGVDSILIGTHARRGLPRLFLGSFAEMLVLRSPIPVITVNPETKVRERIRKILYPTPFLNERKTFERVVSLAKTLESSVLLYYKEPLLPGTYMSPEVYQYLERDAAERTQVSQEWMSWARDQGVATQAHFDNQPGYVDLAIANYAREENLDLIALPTRASSSSAVFIGSIARQLIRHAPCPVWTIHPREVATD